MKKNIYAFAGDFYHNKDNLEVALTKAAQKGDFIIHTKDLTDKEVADALKQQPDVIVIGGEDRISPESDPTNTWLTPETDKALETYVKEGGGLMVVHSGLASYPSDSYYRYMTKGHFIAHPPEHVMVRYHSVDIAGMDKGGFYYDFAVLDEFYQLAVDESETHVFLQSDTEEFGKGFGGWCHNYGKGKVICIVPTHNGAGLADENTINLYQESMNFVARSET